MKGISTNYRLSSALEVPGPFEEEELQLRLDKVLEKKSLERQRQIHGPPVVDGEVVDRERSKDDSFKGPTRRQD